MRTLICPLRSLFNASRRFPGGTLRSFEVFSGIKLIQSLPGNSPKLLRKNSTDRLGAPAVEQVFARSIRKRDDHENIIARLSCYFKDNYAGDFFQIPLKHSLTRCVLLCSLTKYFVIQTTLSPNRTRHFVQQQGVPDVTAY